MNTLSINDDQPCRECDIASPDAGVVTSVHPGVLTPYEEKNLQTGVSTSSVPRRTAFKSKKALGVPQWYVIRCTYGRERKAYEFFSKHGIEAFYPTVAITRTVHGKNEVIEESRLPNILFAFGTFEQLKGYVYDNHHDDTKFLRFYYNIHHDGSKEPLVVPMGQMISLMKICDAEAEDKHLDLYEVEKFKTGQLVRVKEGAFAGVEGIVHRYRGQQRVGVVVKGLFTITTAYISKDKLEFVETI